MSAADLYLLPHDSFKSQVPKALLNTDLVVLRDFVEGFINQAIEEQYCNIFNPEFGSVYNVSERPKVMTTQQMKVVIIDERLKDDKYKLAYATSGSAAFDVRACVNEPLSIPSNQTYKVSLGFKMALPQGTAAILIPRSGSGSQGLVLGNLVGLIDQDYTGEVFATIWNRSSGCFIINPMDRIGQILIVPIVQVEPVIVESLTPTERGEGGFGSTGTA